MCPAISRTERIAKTKTRQAQADNSYESFDREHEHVPPPMDFPKRDFYVNRARTCLEEANRLPFMVTP